MRPPLLSVFEVGCRGRCELYLYVDDIHREFEHAVKIGAYLISPVEDRDWGGGQSMLFY
jgi:uncharacterized glyoxalase superfamily protein PhnB